MTAAHRSLPFGTMVRVTNKHNGRSVVVRINDRGPYVHGRGIDLSQRAAEQIGLDHSGVARVSVAPVDTYETRSVLVVPVFFAMNAAIPSAASFVWYASVERSASIFSRSRRRRC